MTIGALGERWSGQEVVRAPLILSGMRMTSFWVGHTNSFSSPELNGAFYGVSALISIAF
jgi:hypothetical protein